MVGSLLHTILPLHSSTLYPRSNTRSLRHSILYHLKHMHILKICHKTMKHLKRIC